MWNEIAGGAKRSVAAKASSSNGRIGVVDRERPVGALAQLPPLGLELRHGADGGAERAEPAGLAHRPRQLDLVPRAEGRAQDRHVDPEQLAQRGAQHDPIIVGSGAMPQAFYEQHDDVGELVLDAPPLNLFGPAMFDDLEAAIAEVQDACRAR